jgi:hypothetical protein
MTAKNASNSKFQSHFNSNLMQSNISDHSNPDSGLATTLQGTITGHDVMPRHLRCGAM